MYVNYLKHYFLNELYVSMELSVAVKICVGMRERTQNNSNFVIFMSLEIYLPASFACLRASICTKETVLCNCAATYL